MTKRVLLTGGRGFVGRFLHRTLSEAGHKVLVCDLGPAEDSNGFFACDVTDKAAVESLFDRVGEVTHVVHLAAVTFIPEANAAPGRVMEVNHQGTVALTEALFRRYPDALMLYIGSSEAYGMPQSLPVTERHPLAPMTPYAISKAAADHYCRYFFEAGGGRIIRVRPFNHTGPGQSERFALPNFASQIARIESGEVPPVMDVGNLDAARDFTDVRDVVKAYASLLDAGDAGEAYNVCSGKSYSIRSALDLMLGLSEISIDVRVDPDRVRPIDVPEVRGSFAKLRGATGWTPAISFEVTLENLVDSARERLLAERVRGADSG